MGEWVWSKGRAGEWMNGGWVGSSEGVRASAGCLTRESIGGR